jgi:hypothetical protein
VYPSSFHAASTSLRNVSVTRRFNVVVSGASFPLDSLSDIRTYYARGTEAPVGSWSLASDSRLHLDPDAHDSDVIQFPKACRVLNADPSLRTQGWDYTVVIVNSFTDIECNIHF